MNGDVSEMLAALEGVTAFAERVLEERGRMIDELVEAGAENRRVQAFLGRQQADEGELQRLVQRLRRLRGMHRPH